MHNKMFLMILLSIVLGIIFGIYFPDFMISFGIVGKVFINLLKLIVLPLIFCSLVSAITAIGDGKHLGKIGVYTIIYILMSVSIAVTIGLVLLNIFKPGMGMPASLILANTSPMEQHQVQFSDFLLTLFPPNIIEAAAKYEIMPVVFFSVVFALGCLSVGETAQPVVSFFIGMRNVFIKMIIWLMYLTPIGLFSLLGAAVAEASVKHQLWVGLRGLLLFIFIFLIGLFLQVFWQLLLVRFVARRKALQFMSKSSDALITAFATSSSLATMPVTLMVAQKQKITEEVARFVVPFATVINMAGTAMYEAVSALFFTQILGIELSILSQIGVFLTAILAGIGASGIPEGGLVTMVLVLRSVNIPASAIGLLLPFDRILDRFRTMVNVWGDLVCVATIDQLTSKKGHKHGDNT